MRESAHAYAWGIAFAVVAGASVGGCGDVQDESLKGHATSGGVIQVDGGTDEGLNTTGVGAGTGAYTGLPCDVQQLLENRCIGCHLGPNPVALLTYDDLVKPSQHAGKSVAQVALDRMQSTTGPMPPPPAVAPTAQEIATFQGWISAGTPKGAACTTGPGATGADATNPYATPSVCTSGRTWGGGEASGSMDPGRACITCHTKQGGPAFSIAGTVYPTAHEPNDCNGVAGGASVVVMDTAGATIATLSVNSVGNFRSDQSIAPPFRVKVVANGKERAMGGTVTAGDCNSCHGETGANGAPGRIMAP